MLPSQQGFTEDLQATNVITPIIDLTPTAEGSLLSNDLAQAITFGSQTAFNINNTSTTLANSPGFWRIFGVAACRTSSSGNRGIQFNMTDGLSTKTVWNFAWLTTGDVAGNGLQFDFIVYLNAGESINGQSTANGAVLAGSYRQIADVSGNTINPDGFTSE